MEYISLGGTCVTAYQLKKYKIRNQAYPFDHANTNISQLVQVLKNNFNNYVDMDVVKLSHNHCLFYKDKPSLVVKNIYGIKMSHEIDNIDKVNNFSNRLLTRIRRLNDLFNDEHIYIRYIRFENSSYKKNYPERLKELLDYLEIMHPYFTLHLIVHKSYKNFLETIDNSKLTISYFSEYTSDWTYSNLDWKKILTI